MITCHSCDECVVCCQVINECCVLLEKECVSLSAHLSSLRVLPLYVDLSSPAAQQVYDVEEKHQEESVRRRVILTDALGESSFSLNHIRYIIDTGLQLKTVSPSTSHGHARNLSPISHHQHTPFTSADLQPTNQSRFSGSTANQ